jgi:hypothetical protein
MIMMWLSPASFARSTCWCALSPLAGLSAGPIGTLPFRVSDSPAAARSVVFMGYLNINDDIRRRVGPRRRPCNKAIQRVFSTSG